MELIKLKNKLVEDLENKFNQQDVKDKSTIEAFKNEALDVLSGLKRAQDKPENEEIDESLEELIFRVIKLVGQL